MGYVEIQKRKGQRKRKEKDCSFNSDSHMLIPVTINNLDAIALAAGRDYCYKIMEDVKQLKQQREHKRVT